MRITTEIFQKDNTDTHVNSTIEEKIHTFMVAGTRQSHMEVVR